MAGLSSTNWPAIFFCRGSDDVPLSLESIPAPAPRSPRSRSRPLAAERAVKPQPKLNRFGQPLNTRRCPPGSTRRRETRKRYVAVGFSKPTFWPQDGFNNAAEDGKLALALASHVEVFGETAQSNRGKNAQLNSQGGHRSGGAELAHGIDLNRRGRRARSAGRGLGAGGDRYQAGRRRGAGPDDSNTKDGNKMPGWSNHLPASPSRIYAAGYSGPTYTPGRFAAVRRRRRGGEFAASLRSHVQAYQLLVETQSGMSMDDFSHTDDPDKAFLELVKKNARVEQVWVDEQGVRAGDPPGAVWALAGMDAGSEKGGYQSQQNDALGPALDAQGNIPAGVKDAPGGPTLSEQARAQAQQNKAVIQGKVQENKAAIDAHDAEVKKAVQDEQQQYRKETETGVQPNGQGGAQKQ